MCILSYVPKENEDFIITHNRDERIDRPSSEQLIVQTIGQTQVEFPQDLASNGTWILNSSHANKSYITAILNGAFLKHKPNPPYRKSRGNLPFDLLPYNHPNEYFNRHNFNLIEPFTQFILYNNDPFVLIWDGKDKHIQTLKKEVFVTSSSTLYTLSQKEKHKSIIQGRAKTDNSAANLADIHQSLKMELGDVHPLIKTTSITQIIKKNNRIVMNYKVLS